MRTPPPHGMRVGTVRAVHRGRELLAAKLRAERGKPGRKCRDAEVHNVSCQKYQDALVALARREGRLGLRHPGPHGRVPLPAAIGSSRRDAGLHALAERAVTSTVGRGRSPADGEFRRARTRATARRWRPWAGGAWLRVVAAPAAAVLAMEPPRGGSRPARRRRPHRFRCPVAGIIELTGFPGPPQAPRCPELRQRRSRAHQDRRVRAARYGVEIPPDAPPSRPGRPPRRPDGQPRRFDWCQTSLRTQEPMRKPQHGCRGGAAAGGGRDLADVPAARRARAVAQQAHTSPQTRRSSDTASPVRRKGCG